MERIQAGADNLSSCTISQDAPGPETLIYARVSEYEVERFEGLEKLPYNVQKNQLEKR